MNRTRTPPRQAIRYAAIAQRLLMSSATVKVHSSSIYAKLGTSSRTELAAEVTRRTERNSRLWTGGAAAYTVDSPGYTIARHSIKPIDPHVEGPRWTTDGRYLVFGLV